ncbi:class I SAM-dependent methyltransferase [Roseisolibacter sp. H3M3-2]|uniref:class I SAM-dependent methyltransferase n=1 Tax=Roseisolibacter sp. H3M3-2 TaxID=3031323 RepID=UPI0023DC4A70|nr:class I SAM-dependent methyltransferase [Roseisolibacter sp. H3M3-2]MDF1505970.1 class I SAM-dependent methyltransferase [Roseisolibacter sp. H3M3-2]
MSAACKMCGGARWARTFAARERQFALPGEFTYGECAACGSLQLLDVPASLGDYYPPGYYSFEVPAGGGPVARLKRASALAAVTGRGAVGRALGVLQPPPTAGMAHWLAAAGATPDTRVLDVGCGSGALLRAMDAVGYRDLTGVDPFLDRDRTVGRVRLLRGTVEAMDATFDLVMMHHALEHVPEPAETLRALRARLSAGGHCLVRVPVAPSEAFRRYGDRWVQLDAPRHLVIPNADALERLAARLGLALVERRHDSTAIQFWGSELYARDVPLSRADVGWVGKQRGRLRAARANRRGEGDQAAFLFRAV